MFCAQGALDQFYRHDRFDWHTNSKPLLKKLDTEEWKNYIQNFKCTGSAELNQNSYKGPPLF